MKSKSGKTEEQHFYEELSWKSDSQILEIIQNPQNFNNDSVKAAARIAAERKLISSEKETDMLLDLEFSDNIDENNNADTDEIVELSSLQIAEGLNRFWSSLIIFVLANTLCLVLGVNLGNEWISSAMMVVVGVFLVAFNVNFIKTGTVSERKFSDFAIWLAGVYLSDEISGLRSQKKVQGLIWALLLIPFIAIDQTVNRNTELVFIGEGYVEDFYNYNINNNISENENVNEVYLRSDTDVYIDSIKQQFYDKGKKWQNQDKYAEAISCYNEVLLLNLNVSDTAMLMSMAYCYEKLQKPDSACKYIRLALEFGSYEAAMQWQPKCR